MNEYKTIKPDELDSVQSEVEQMKQCERAIHKPSMLLRTKDSVLVLMDMQENNINFIHHHEQTIANCKDLILMATKFNVPVITSEHIPEVTGPTIPDLAKFLPKDCFICKSEFSLFPKLKKALSLYSSIVLAGIETHICILQTAIEIFFSTGKNVFVVVDATNSRFSEDKHFAIQRMQQLGVQIVTKQMVFFEWASTSEHPVYKELNKKIVK